MRLESQIDKIYGMGAEPVGISVDPEGRNAAMVARWRLSFGIASDPGGDRFLRPLDLWDEVDPRQIGIPAVIVLTPDGTEIYRHRSRDFADRPDDADVFAALQPLALPAIRPAPWKPSVEPEEHPGAFRADAFGHYHRGVMFATGALAARMTDPGDRRESEMLAGQASSFLAAWKAVRSHDQP